MNDILSLEELKNAFPEAVVDGQLALDKLCVALASQVVDLQDQMNEKDFQILRITQRLDELSR